MSRPDLSPVVSPSRSDALVAAASEVVGGPAGRRLGAGRRGLVWALPVLLVLTTVTLAAGVVAKQHCRDRGWVAPDHYVHACYSDVPVLIESARVAEPGLPLGHDGSSLAQPALGVLVYDALSRAAGAGELVERQRRVFDAVTLALAVAAMVTVTAVVALSARRRWDAGLVATSPVLALVGLVSLDLLAVAAAAGAVWAWARSRPVVAGLLLGLAVSTRPALVVVLVALVVVAVRAGATDAMTRAVLAAAASWTAVNAPLIVTAMPGWSAVWSQWWRSPAGFGSLWLLPQVAGRPLPDRLVTAGSVAATAAVVLGVVVATLATRRRPRLPVVALLLLVGCLLAAKSLPLQASLLLVPFAALAIPRWRDHTWWWAAEAFAFVVTWQYLVMASAPDRAAPPWLYAAAVIARAAALIWLGWCAWRTASSPAQDVVRTGEHNAGWLGERVDDPAGGPVDGAPDAFVIRFG